MQTLFNDLLTAKLARAHATVQAYAAAPAPLTRETFDYANVKIPGRDPDTGINDTPRLASASAS